MSRPVFGVAFFLHLCVSVFFIVLGLEGFLYVWGIVGRSDVAMIAAKLTGIFGGDSAVYIILISISTPDFCAFPSWFRWCCG